MSRHDQAVPLNRTSPWVLSTNPPSAGRIWANLTKFSVGIAGTRVHGVNTRNCTIITAEIELCGKMWRDKEQQDRQCTYNVTLWARSHYHWCDGNVTMRSACTVVLHLTECSKTMLLSPIYFAGKNKTYLGLHVKCPTSLSVFKQIWSVSTDLRKSQWNQISRKFAQWELRWYMRTDMTKLKRDFRDLWERTYNGYKIDGDIHERTTQIWM